MTKLKICPRHLECTSGCSRTAPPLFPICGHNRPHKCLPLQDRDKKHPLEDGFVIRYQPACESYGNRLTETAGPCIIYKKETDGQA